MNPLSRIFSRMQSRPKRDAPPLSMRPLPYTRLTLDQWREAPERVAYVAELLRQPLFLDLLGMLAGIRPLHRGAVDATTAAILLGQRTGHDQVIASLLAAGTSAPTDPPPLPPADYGAENLLQQWETEGDMRETQ